MMNPTRQRTLRLLGLCSILATTLSTASPLLAQDVVYEYEFSAQSGPNESLPNKGCQVKISTDDRKVHVIAADQGVDWAGQVPANRWMIVDKHIQFRIADGTVTIEARLLKEDYNRGWIEIDGVKYLAFLVDLDVDSDNTNNTYPYGPHDGDDAADAREDTIEDDEDKPGKYICVNDDDDDQDGVPDLQDGCESPNPGACLDDTNPMENDFVKMVLEISAPVDLNTAKIKISASLPPPIVRIWTKSGKVARRKALFLPDGDLVDWDTYDPSDLGLSNDNRKIDLWLEGLSTSTEFADRRIVVEVDPAGGSPANFTGGDAVRVTVVGTELDGLRVFDPKLPNAGSAEITYRIKGLDVPRVELTILDGTTEVAALVRKTEASPAPDVWVTKSWDGKWGIKQDGTDTAHKDLFADPKKYTVKLKVYGAVDDGAPACTHSYDLYVVRLGPLQIAFADDLELLFHKTRPGTETNFSFTNNAVFGSDVVWKIEKLDFDKGGGETPRTEARKEKNSVGESFNDTNNSGTRDGAEQYFDADGNTAYTADLRQANFPGSIPTGAIDTEGGVDTTNYNRPAVYVRDSKVKVRIKTGPSAISDLTGGNVGVGYPVTTYPIELRPEFKTAAMNGGTQTATTNLRNIAPSGGPYVLESADTAKLANTVGYAVESVEFKFRYNATGESYVDTNGNGAFDGGDTLVNDDGNGAFDEDWKDIPGAYTTTHLIYRLAATPTATARGQGGGRVFMKIVDFTCDWGTGENTSAGVFSQIWTTNNFWTPFVAGPVPDNANGFHGVGDTTEAGRNDFFGNAPKCYTYEHDMGAGNGFTVDELLDTNAGRCGAFGPFLSGFAGTQGYGVKPLGIKLLARRDRGGVISHVTYASVAAGGNAVGDNLYVKGASVGAPDAVTGIKVNPAISGQANPAGQAHLVTYFDNHCATFLDANSNGAFDGGGVGELIFDGSYDHSGGAAQAGYASVQAYENSALVSYLWQCRINVTGVNAAGQITATGVACPGAGFTFPNAAGQTEVEGLP